jgi:hypothetical protein
LHSLFLYMGFIFPFSQLSGITPDWNIRLSNFS